MRLIRMVAFVAALLFSGPSVLEAETRVLPKVEFEQQPVEEVLAEIFAANGFKYRLSPEVRGRVERMNSRNVTFAEAVHEIVCYARAAYWLNGDVFEIVPREELLSNGEAFGEDREQEPLERTYLSIPDLVAGKEPGLSQVLSPEFRMNSRDGATAVDAFREQYLASPHQKVEYIPIWRDGLTRSAEVVVRCTGPAGKVSDVRDFWRMSKAKEWQLVERRRIIAGEDLHFENAVCSDVLTALGMQYPFEWILEGNHPARLTIDLNGQSFESALAKFCDVTDSSLKLNQGYYRLTSGAALGPIDTQCTVFSSFETDNVDLESALRMLCDRDGWSPYIGLTPKISGRVSFHGRNRNFAVIMNSMIRQVGATYDLWGSGIQLRPYPDRDIEPDRPQLSHHR